VDHESTGAGFLLVNIAISHAHRDDRRLSRSHRLLPCAPSSSAVPAAQGVGVDAEVSGCLSGSASLLAGLTQMRESQLS
jgi:hypothetical protein